MQATRLQDIDLELECRHINSNSVSPIQATKAASAGTQNNNQPFAAEDYY